jgi:hypothetical protein
MIKTTLLRRQSDSSKKPAVGRLSPFRLAAFMLIRMPTLHLRLRIFWLHVMQLTIRILGFISKIRTSNSPT